MKVKLKEFQEACKIILGAIDNKVSVISQEERGYNSLELATEGKVLHLNVASKEYYVSVNLNLETEETLRAVIDAKVFLKLVSKLTSEYIDLEVVGDNLVLKSSGEYKFPLKLDMAGKLITLPIIDIASENVTASFPIDSAVLLSILKYNAKDLESSANAIKRPAQSLFYIDQDGCITWTETSVCVNAFKLVNPVKVLLEPKTIKLFKLFDSGEVQFTLGYENVGAKLQTRIRFKTDTIDIVSIAQNDVSLMGSVPVPAIRGMVENTYPYSVNINTEDFVSALQRLMLFDTNVKEDSSDIAQFRFTGDGITITKRGNTEFVSYENTFLESGTDVTIYLNVSKLSKVLENSEESYLAFNFGPTDRAILLSKGNIKNIVSVSKPKGL